jgi:C1A family cysteine protease
MEGQMLGGHAIEVIGYCEPDTDKRIGFEDMPYWICRNSWSKDWPIGTNDNGYFAIKMGDNMCGVESRCCRGNLNIITSNNIDKELTAYYDYDSFIEDLKQKQGYVFLKT